MLRYLLLLPLIFCINIFADVSLSSPKIKLNDKDQRIIEFKIENESINDGDIILFPPYLEHEVKKQTSESMRLTFSFNLTKQGR